MGFFRLIHYLFVTSGQNNKCKCKVKRPFVWFQELFPLFLLNAITPHSDFIILSYPYVYKKKVDPNVQLRTLFTEMNVSDSLRVSFSGYLIKKQYSLKPAAESSYYTEHLLVCGLERNVFGLWSKCRFTLQWSFSVNSDRSAESSSAKFYV